MLKLLEELATRPTVELVEIYMLVPGCNKELGGGRRKLDGGDRISRWIGKIELRSYRLVNDEACR
jgi:hypothetical protein